MKSEKETLFSLAPNINLEDDAHYKVYEAYLDSALKNQIDNLAITGKYGSGKSSIVDTYFHNKEDVLKVSFSTFKNSKENGKSFEDDTKGIVFANIINQIIYQIDSKKIPLTRFKLKKPLSCIAKSVLALEIVLILSQIVIPKRDGISFFILSTIIFLISTILGFIILWQLFSRIELKNFKFSVKPVEAEIDIKSDELFEKYTDEIIYLFRKSEKSIFIIEDLDRFGDLSIFEKLRELNIKLNAIEHWTFIYLIKDDLFLNKTDRVKFFDQIIPVIPFITTNNSFDKLREIFSEKVIDNRLLRILSQFIDDYRLLLNIHNEYEVYSKVASLNQNSDIEKQQNELLALIAYKNLYPNHFDDIQNGKGLLNEIVSNYKDDIKIEIDDVSQKIQSLKEKKDSSALKKESELLYVWANEKNFVFFESGTGYYSGSSISSLAQAESIIENDYYIASRNSTGMRLQYSEFKEQTEDYLDNFSGIVNFNVELQKLNERLISLGRYDLSDVPTFSASTKEQELLYALIKNRYITLDYLNIINHYYGDSSTQTFMRKLYTASDDFDINLRLNDIPGLFEQLEDDDFEQVQVLNIDFAIWLQTHHPDKFYKVLSTAKHSDTGFLEQLIDYDDKFYKIITNLIEGIKFDLSILSSIHRYIIAFDIAVNNHYEKSQVNIEWITNHLKKNIKLADYINLLNSQNVFLELKTFLIQNVQDSLPINKISDVSENLVDLIIEQGGFRLTSSNINYYIEKKSFNHLLENFMDGHQIEFDEILTKESFSSTLSDTSLGEKTFKDIWMTYDGEEITAQAISQLPNNLILVLLRLEHLKVDSDLLTLLVDKNVNVEVEFFTHSIKQKFIEYQVAMNDILLKKALTLLDDINHDLFSYNINSLAVSDVKQYLEMNHLSDGKFIKIIEHKQGYQNILLDNNSINDRVLNWMKNNDIISDVKIVNDKFKPLYF